MEKREVVIGLKPLAQIKFQDKYIDVTPNISQEVQYDLARSYTEILFGTEDIVQNYYSAEWHLALSLVDKCTSLVVLDENEKKNIEFDMLMTSGLWDSIKNEIVNYNEFREFLKEICQAIREEKALQKSFGQALDKITNKVVEFIDKIGSLDISEEGVAKLISGLNTQVSQFKTDFPTSEAVAPKVKRQYKKKEK
jgi:hypothetical protein